MTAAALPLFYLRPEPLLRARHGALHLTAETDFKVAADTNAVPVMVGEFAEAMRFYPIVFAGEPAHPVAVLGLKTRNMFVDAKGEWAQGHYIPAYVRRYPFVFFDTGDQGFALGIDVGCDRLTDKPAAGKVSLPLFNGDEPAEITQGALQFCAALQAEQQMTKDFMEAVIAQDLLIEQQVQGETASGEALGLTGFRVIDAQKFTQLPADIVAKWHGAGWLALITLHLASLHRLRDLLARYNDQPAAPPAKSAPQPKTPAAV